MNSKTQMTDLKITMKLPAESGLTDQAKANREIIFCAYAAMANADIGALAQYFDNDILFVEPTSLPYGRKVRGIEAAMNGLAALFAAWCELHIEIEEILASGDLVCAYMNVHTVSRTTGQVYDAMCAEIYRFKDGKIIELRPFYWDTHAARLACGLT